MGKGDAYESAWRHLAGRTRLLVNTGWVLTSAALPMLSACAGCSILIVSGRKLDLQLLLLLITTLAVILSVACWSLLRATRRFITVEDALELLDDGHALRNRLSASRDGAFMWPEPPSAAISRRITLSFRTPVAVMLCGAAMVTAATLTPMSKVRAGAAPEIVKPAQVAALEALVEELKEEKLVDSRSLEELQSKIDELTSKPQEEWYDHDTLEAADALTEATQRDLARLQNQLADTSRAARDLSAAGEQEQSTQPEKLRQELRSKAEALGNGTFAPSEELAKALENAARQEGMKLSSEESQKLSELMQKHAQELAKKQQNHLPGAKSSQGQSCPKPSPGNNGGSCPAKPNPGEGESKPGPKKDGMPGPGRGGDTAPLDMREQPPKLTSSREAALTESVGRQDDKPGDLVGLSGEVPEAVKPSGPSTGGAVLDDGLGGEASWQQTLTPEEQEVLRQFYK